MINRPTLPPRAGYVEVDDNGVRRYAPTAETREALRREEDARARKAVLEEENRRKDAQIAALSEQNDFHEELIVELANVVYA